MEEKKDTSVGREEGYICRKKRRINREGKEEEYICRKRRRINLVGREEG